MNREKVINYFNAQAINGNWASLYDPDNPVSYSFIQRFIKTVKLMQPIKGTILDMGCGTGIMVKVVNENNAHYIGFDASKEMTEACQKQFNDLVRKGEAEFYYSDSRNFKSKHLFSCAVGMGYLEYFENPDECLQEAKAILKDDGRLILSFPHKNSLDNFGLLILKPFRKLATFITGKSTTQPPRKYWQRSEAETLFIKNGFKVNNVVYYNTGIFHYPFTKFAPSFSTAVASKLENSFINKVPFFSTGFIICGIKVRVGT